MSSCNTYVLTIHAAGNRARKQTFRLTLRTQLAQLLNLIRCRTTPMFYIPNPINIHWA